MGMVREVRFTDAGPDWSNVTQRLPSLQMRMIDNMPAFPDEVPPEDWKELRVSLGSDMITIRRAPQAWSFVVWGNAGARQLAERDQIIEAVMAVGGGTVSE